MSLGSSLIDGDFVDCGINRVKVDVVCKKWDARFFITSWHDRDFRLVARRKNGKAYLLKFTISKEQALDIIDALHLNCVADDTFANAKLFKLNDGLFFKS